MFVFLRWLAVLPAAYAGWVVALVLGMCLHSFAEMFCSPNEVDSGMCVASWFPYAVKIIFCFCSALAASLVVIFATVVAPSHRSFVARVTFIIGAIVAVYMGTQTSAYFELAAALLAGFVVTWWLNRRFKCSIAEQPLAAEAQQVAPR